MFKFNVASVMLAMVEADPNPTSLIPLPFDVALDVLLVIVLFEIVAFEIVPSKLKMSMPW